MGIYSGYLLCFTGAVILFHIAITDIKTGYVNDLHAGLAVIFSYMGRVLLAGPGFGTEILLYELIPGAVAGTLITGICLLTRKRGMGTGDILPAIAFATLLGYPLAIFDIFILSALIMIFRVFYLCFKCKKKYKDVRVMPFVPFMFSASIVALLLKNAGISIYICTF